MQVISKLASNQSSKQSSKHGSKQANKAEDRPGSPGLLGECGRSGCRTGMLSGDWGMLGDRGAVGALLDRGALADAVIGVSSSITSIESGICWVAIGGT